MEGKKPRMGSRRDRWKRKKTALGCRTEEE